MSHFRYCIQGLCGWFHYSKHRSCKRPTLLPCNPEILKCHECAAKDPRSRRHERVSLGLLDTFDTFCLAEALTPATAVACLSASWVRPPGPRAKSPSTSHITSVAIAPNHHSSSISILLASDIHLSPTPHQEIIAPVNHVPGKAIIVRADSDVMAVLQLQVAHGE